MSFHRQRTFEAPPLVVYGGAAGGGKSYGLLLDPLRYINTPGFGAVIFRRESPQITNEGGLWDKSLELYSQIGATPRRYDLSWNFQPAGVKIRFSHLQRDDDVLKWQGSEIAYLGFDELTHFTAEQFFYMLSRNRSTCGIKPCVRATTNPAPGWVRNFLAPWLDKTYENPALSGEVRHFIRKDGSIVWVDGGYRDKDGTAPKSVTFVRSTIYDNKILLEKDPGYITNLKSLPPVEQARLLHGDWDIFEGAFYSEFSEVRHTCPPLYNAHSPYNNEYTLPSHWTFFGGLDWGYADPFAFTLCATDEHGTVHVIESVQSRSLTDDQQADKVCGILARWGVRKDHCLIVYDQSMQNQRASGTGVKGEANVEAYYRAGLQMAASEAGHDAKQSGVSQVRRFLHSDNALKIWKGYNADLIRVFPLAQYNKRGEDKEAMQHDETSHLLDAIRYALSTRPRPSDIKLAPLPRNAPEWAKEALRNRRDADGLIAL